ncbi:peptidoglycan DD-metalloendopeptidase family protein [Arthrobacter sp. D5-1]|uniref:peptidoglycan DD-metalloendopeptidase family protein n=1 Tax=Arthrobacter sp. D5-1 TaxID=1477518 RepID=UPI001A98000E|nr:peptidoglycan DD-metalloendopeptidase family protein [Arthrobacter sp. D5-1]QSZ47233.1 hypothetical protein AYX22_01580 [Arthrobacter sp. D5-1]
MPVIGRAQVLVEPTFKGTQAQVAKVMDGVGVSAGRSAGVNMGKGMSSGFAEGVAKLKSEVAEANKVITRSQAQITAAQAKIAASTEAEAKALGAVRVAELKLQEVRNNSKAKASQLAAAEEALETARRKAAAATNTRKTAEDNLTKSTTDLKNAQDKSAASSSELEKKIKDVGDQSAESEKKVSKLGGAVSKGLKWGAIAVGTAAVAGLGVALTKGFDRLQSIENAKAKLLGLGHDVESVTSIMNDAMSAVKGTAFGLDEAASVAAGAVASGVQPGKDLERTLRLTGDAATIAGVGMDEMGAIFNKVAASNKIQGDVIAQLQDAGIPIVQLMGKELGTTADETLRLASEGKINFETFQKAMENGLGGAALKSGDTLQGAFKNTMAAVGRIGANLLSGVYPKIREFFAGAIEWLKPLEEGAKVAGAAIGDGLSWALTKAQEFGSYFQTTILPVLQGFGTWVVQNKDWLVALGVALTAGVVAFRAYLIVNSVAAALQAFSLATTIATAKTWLFSTALFANPIGLVIAAIAALVAGLIWFFTQTELGQQIVQNVWGAIQSFIGGTVTWFQTYVLPTIQAIFAGVGAVFSWLYTNIIQPVFAQISWAAQAAWTILDYVFQIIGAVITKVVGPAFNWLWTSVIQPVFGFIGALISAWWTTIVKPIFDAVVWVMNNVLGPAFSWLYANVIKPQFEAIGAIIKWVWDTVIKPVFDFISDVITKTIPKAFEDGVNFIKTHWDKIQDIAKAPVKFVVDTVINDGLINGLNGIGGALGLDKLPRVALPPGFADGGYTGPGGKFQPAGIVHAGEVVWSQDDISRWGGVGVVEALRQAKGYATGGLVHPLPGSVVSQPFHGGHNGMDFAAGTGTPVRAAGPGRVSSAGWSSYGGGNEIHIDHPNGLQTWYAHLSSFAVKLGQMVTGGSKIGEVGSTGNSTGPHLHYMVLNGGWPNYRNPAEYLAGGGAGGDGGFNPIAGIIDGLVDQFKKAFPAAGMFADLAIGAGKKILTGAVDFVTGNGGKDSMGSTGLPYLHDNGGILNPGLSQIMNATRKPEYILNDRQWDAAYRALQQTQGPGRGDTHFHGNVGWDPDEVSYRIEARRQDTFAAFGI